MDIEATNIFSLLELSLEWSSSDIRDGLYGTSKDRGFVCARKEYFHHKEFYYDTIVLTQIVIPAGHRGNGIYKNFVKSIDVLGTFGVRSHQSVQNARLRNHHKKGGGLEINGSYYFFIGDPVSPHLQASLEKELKKAEEKFAKKWGS